MGKKQKALEKLLTQAGYRHTAKPPQAGTDQLSADALDTFLDVYAGLGGQPRNGGFKASSWDIALEGGLLIELDEENHFNRHRALTLETPVPVFPWTGDYRRYCTEQEKGCVKYGGYWTTNGSEAMFGKAAAPGNHDGAGSPRWRQRALYDVLRDMSAQAHSHWRLARLSIYDEPGGVRLGRILEGRHPADPDSLRELIEARTAH